MYLRVNYTRLGDWETCRAPRFGGNRVKIRGARNRLRSFLIPLILTPNGALLPRFILMGREAFHNDFYVASVNLMTNEQGEE